MAAGSCEAMFDPEVIAAPRAFTLPETLTPPLPPRNNPKNYCWGRKKGGGVGGLWFSRLSGPGQPCFFPSDSAFRTLFSKGELAAKVIIPRPQLELLKSRLQLTWAEGPFGILTWALLFLGYQHWFVVFKETKRTTTILEGPWGQ